MRSPGCFQLFTEPSALAGRGSSLHAKGLAPPDRDAVILCAGNRHFPPTRRILRFRQNLTFVQPGPICEYRAPSIERNDTPHPTESGPFASIGSVLRTLAYSDHGRQNPDRVGESRVAPSAVSAHPRRPANHRAGADRSNGDQADRQVLDDAAAGPEFELVPVWSRQNHRIDRDDSVVLHPSLTVAGIVLGRALAPGVEVLYGAAEVQNHYGDLVCRSPCLVRR